MSYQDWFLRVEKELQRLRKEGIQLAANVIGQTLYEDDFYTVSILDKCIRLIDGFIDMLAASGYIHYSEKAFYASVSVKELNILDINVGHPIRDELDSVLQECAEAFIYFVKFQYKLTIPVVESKNRIDAQ